MKKYGIVGFGISGKALIPVFLNMFQNANQRGEIFSELIKNLTK